MIRAITCTFICAFSEARRNFRSISWLWVVPLQVCLRLV